MTQNKNLPSTGHVLEHLRNVFKYVLSAPPKSQQNSFFFFSFDTQNSVPESGEEASALCSYVFEGHYTDEATERTVDC